MLCRIALVCLVFNIPVHAIIVSRRHCFKGSFLCGIASLCPTNAKAEDPTSTKLFRRSRARVGEGYPISTSSRELTLSVELDPSLHFTDGAPSSYQLMRDDDVVSTGLLGESNSVIKLSLPGNENIKNLELYSRVYYCDSANACRVDNYLVPLVDGGSSELGARRIVQRIDKPPKQSEDR